MDEHLVVSLLFLVALAAPLVSVVNSAVQLLRRREAAGVGGFGGLLALIAAMAALGLLIASAFLPAFPLHPAPVLAVLGAVELGFGLTLLALVERRRPAFAPDRSYGLLNAGLGFLTVIAALFIPLLPGQFFPPAPSQALALPTVSPVPAATRTPTPAPSPTLFATTAPSTTPTPPPMASPTATRARYSTPVPSITPTARSYCGAVVQYNLNLRSRPLPDAEVLETIPYRSVVRVGGRNNERSWWFIVYNNVWGWVDGRYISPDTDCDSAPVMGPE